jgi:hypothetical protein
VKPILRAAVAVAATGAVLLSCSAPADADPIEPYVVNYAQTTAQAICATLDDYPSLPGIDGVLQGIQDDSGFTGRQAAQVLVLAVDNRCPRHLPLLRRYVATYAPTPKGTTV